jgi:hypothetical protein
VINLIKKVTLICNIFARRVALFRHIHACIIRIWNNSNPEGSKTKCLAVFQEDLYLEFSFNELESRSLLSIDFNCMFSIQDVSASSCLMQGSYVEILIFTLILHPLILD